MTDLKVDHAIILKGRFCIRIACRRFLADLYVLAFAKSSASEMYYAGAQGGIKTKALAEALSQGAGNGGVTKETSMPELIDNTSYPFITFKNR